MSPMRKSDPKKQPCVRSRKPAETIVIRGVVTGSRWDEHFNVVEVSISSTDEKEYVIENRGKGAELIEHEMENVEVEGVRSDEESSSGRIRVKSYRIVRPSNGSEIWR